jgi:hypothetical protein
MFGTMELVLTMALSHRPRLQVTTTATLPLTPPPQQIINEMKKQFYNHNTASSNETAAPSNKRARENLEDVFEVKYDSNNITSNETRFDEDWVKLKRWEKNLQEQEDYELYKLNELEKREEGLDAREQTMIKQERDYSIWKTRASEAAEQLKLKETESVRFKLELDEINIKLQEQRNLITELGRVSKEKLFEVELNSVDAELKALTVRRADLVNKLEQLNEKKQSNK